MTDRAIVATARQAYITRMQTNKEIQRILKSAKAGEASMADLQKFSQISGDLAAQALQKAVGDDMAGLQQYKEAAVRELMQLNAQFTNQASQLIQKGLLEQDGIGLNPTDVSVSKQAVQDIVTALGSSEDLAEAVAKAGDQIKYYSQKMADDSERASASFQNAAGLEVLVTREYDDVGVHTTDKDGGEPCQWCLDRCGTDVPYRDALARGMFERHPGCGCIITYRSSRGEITRNAGGGWKNVK